MRKADEESKKINSAIEAHKIDKKERRMDINHQKAILEDKLKDAALLEKNETELLRVIFVKQVESNL